MIHNSNTMLDPDTLISHIKNPRKADKALIENAYAFAQQAHEGQKRFSGEPYVNHVIATAQKLAELHMDATTIAAGLLHDVLEDGNVEEETVRKEFGDEILFLVKGVTKLGKYKYKGLERHSESLRKFLIATAQDVRVLIIRLADRLHNMQTLEYVRPDKQKRIALETLEIYAPLAGRLGIDVLRGELEDLAFPYVYPKEYAQVRELHREQKKALEKRVESARRTLLTLFHEENVEISYIGARVKHYYSLYKKLKKRDMDIEKVFDVAALRIIVKNVGDCYRALGLVHQLFTPIPGRVKDYIASPKPNGYRSLHTSVFTGDGGRIEIQIRTEAMQREAEYGIAAHLSYKEGDSKGASAQSLPKSLSWIQQFTEWQKNISESGEFLKDLKMDFFRDRVFVFTPQGDVIDLPEESSPIDFAYAIHSEIGDHFAGAKINGKLSALDTKLKSGDIVEIITKESSKPSSKWLESAKTAMARKNIKAALAKDK